MRSRGGWATLAIAATAGAARVDADPSAAAVAAEKTSEQQHRAAAELICVARSPECDWLATLGSLEQITLVRALAARGLVLEPMPWDKPIEEVHVYNEDVFVEGGAFFRWFNHFHVTTKEAAVRGELVIGAGEVWDQARVEESARRLRDPLYTSVIAIVPVRAKDPTKVSMLVITRDIFSLRLNTTYTYQESSLTNLIMSFSENNFLGERNVVAAGLTMDQGSIAVGPIFLDKNVAGSHIQISARVDDIITRQSLAPGDPKGIEDAGVLHNEGTDSNISVGLPLWSLASEWGWNLSFQHSWSVQRQFFGTGLLAYDDPDTPQREALPWEYGLHYWTSTANVTRQWGTAYKSQLTVGHTVTSQHPYFLSDFTTDPTLRAAFERDVFPVNEVDSAPYVEYVLFEPRYNTLRNVGTYDLAEDARYGPSLDTSLSVGLTELGSTYNFQRASTTVSYVVPWTRDGFVSGTGAVSVRQQGGALIDNTASVTLRIATPSSWDVGRIVLQSSLATRWHDTQNIFYGIGSDTGLRGFVVNEFIGERRLSNMVEARTRAVKTWVLRTGGVLFYENGDAANSLATMHLYHDVGAGLRVLIPQTSRSLFRFDFAFPLNGPDPGAPHFIAGFDSYF